MVPSPPMTGIVISSRTASTRPAAPHTRRGPRGRCTRRGRRSRPRRAWPGPRAGRSLVIDDEDGPEPRRSSRFRRAISLPAASTEEDANVVPEPGGSPRQRTAVGVDDAQYGGETRPPAGKLGGEERVEMRVLVCSVHSAPCRALRGRHTLQRARAGAYSGGPSRCATCRASRATSTAPCRSPGLRHR